MSKKVAVVLTGCGFQDGAEITEAVSTLISLGQAGATYQVFAPDKEVATSNHLTGAAGEPRHILAEAARISRGQVRPLKELKANDFDGVAFPGGFGAALHLCTWAKEGHNCQVDSEAQRVVSEFYEQSKPIGAFCIAPALIAKLLGDKNVSVTIGNDRETAQEIEKTGAEHVECKVDDFVTDREHKVITAPAYMYGDARPDEVFKGIHAAINELVEMA